MADSTHDWRFFRAGGFNQVRLDRGSDLVALRQLDQKLWVALACPVKGLELDLDTLALMDTDSDGRIRAPELISTAEWIDAVLKTPDTLLEEGDSLALAAIDDTHPKGAAIIASARQILAGVGKADATSICLADVSDTAKVFAGNRFNGDGIIPPAAAQDETLEDLIKDVIAAMGAVTDRTGEDGVDQATLDAFFTELQAYADWWASSEGDAEKLPLGDATAAAAAAYDAVSAKVDDYFTRCRLVAFDPRSADAMNGADTDWQSLSKEKLTASDDKIAAFPLAHIQADKALPLDKGLNPAWVDRIAALRTAALTPIVGPRGMLTEADWDKIGAKLAAFQAWTGTKAGAVVESLGLEKIRAWLAGDAKAQLSALIAADLNLKPEADAIDSVEKIVRFKRDFQTLAENFVNFRRFYNRGEKSVFQTGELFIDNRSCDLVMRVDDVAKHGALAGLSACYIAYLKCTRKGTVATRTIAAVFTDGDVDFLRVGRNGVFYDRDGNDWDATITKVIENPLSLRQAFWAPYKRVVRAIETQVEKAAAAKEKAAKAKMDGNLAKAKTGATAKPGKPVDPKAPPAKAPAFDAAKYAGIFAAVGLAAGVLIGALSMLLTGFFNLTWWQMPLVILAVMLLISAPSVFLAALKLRTRNLGPILEANGWAINARARINIPFGRSLTHLAALPEGASFGSDDDPYAEESSKWPLVKNMLIGYIVVSIGFGIWVSIKHLF